MKQVATNQMEQTRTNEFGSFETVEWKYSFDNKIEADITVKGQQVQVYFSDDHEYLFSTIIMKKKTFP